MDNNWKEINGKLVKEFKFKDFKEALLFINKVGDHAESINHHPKIINVYNSVIIELWTHDKDAITDLDYALSGLIDTINL
ncbi:MAG: 4a-hydroxytetrahydrobiopterin dehydratase [Flavobacteriaceae bacterium]|tara:strand:+ start:1004 stop:1243 length:240 start_codon:yes stop_codon:yes gene_type:complete